MEAQILEIQIQQNMPLESLLFQPALISSQLGGGWVLGQGKSWSYLFLLIFLFFFKFYYDAFDVIEQSCWGRMINYKND